MYLPSVHNEIDFSILVTGFLVLSSIKEILRLTVTPCWKLPFALLKFGNAIGELDTKKSQAIGKLKNLTMVYKWGNIKGQVAHHSWGTWGLEGNNGLGATYLMSKSVYPTMTAVNSVYTRHLTETNGLFRTSGEFWQAQMVRGRCPSDGPVYPCKTDTVSSPRGFHFCLDMLRSTGMWRKDLGSSCHFLSAKNRQNGPQIRYHLGLKSAILDKDQLVILPKKEASCEFTIWHPKTVRRQPFTNEACFPLFVTNN